MSRSLARLVLCLLLAPIVATPTMALDNSLTRVRQAGVLRWGGDLQGGEPYAFEDPNQGGRLVGFEVEIADALARQLGVRAEFVQNDWSTLIPSLERGNFDIAMNGIEVTPARQERLTFSKPYFRFREVLVVRRDQGAVHGLADLAGRPVGTLASSQAFDLLRGAAVDVRVYEGTEEPYLDLEQGRLDGVLLDNVIAERYGLRHADLQAAAEIADGVYAIGLRRDDIELRRAIDTGLDKLRQSGELRRILETWKLWDARQEQAAELPTAAAIPVPASINGAHVLLFLRGALVTMAISLLAMLVAVGGGLGLSLARRYGGRVSALMAQVYIELFRGTPVLLQLYVLYYGLAPWLTLSAFTAAVIGLGMNYAAYEAELYRAGLEAIPIGQTEAALALGMSRPQALRRIVLPQALRVALPGIANDFIALLKDSSLVSVISVVELTKQMTITSVDVRSWALPGLLCAMFYLAMSYPLSRLAQRLETRLHGGAA